MNLIISKDVVNIYCEDVCGKKYMRPVMMSVLLNCDVIDLCAAIEKHKRSIGAGLLLVGNYGNANYQCNPVDKVYLQGWINFLSLPCFNDSYEAKKMVEILKEV